MNNNTPVNKDENYDVDKIQIMNNLKIMKHLKIKLLINLKDNDNSGKIHNNV